MFKAAEAKSNDLPFATSPIMPGLLSGEVDAAVQFPGALAANVQAGKLRLLALLTAARDPLFPEVPTARELGIDVVLEAWRGIATPKGTPSAVITAMQDAIRPSVESPEFAQVAKGISCIPRSCRPPRLAK